MEQAKNIVSPFSRESFIGLKGYMAVLVLIHHLYQYTAFLENTSWGYYLYLLGHYAVVGFIFMSGFGIYASYLSKGEAYIKSFPHNRLLPFYLSYLVFVVIYTVYDTILNTPPSIGLLLTSLTYGGTVVSFGWYLQRILLLYIIFYLLKLVIKSDRLFLTILGIFTFAYLAYFFYIGETKNAYEPILFFHLGVITANCQGKLAKSFAQKPLLWAFIGLALFVGFTIADTLIVYRQSEAIATNRWVDFSHLAFMIIADIALLISMLSFAAISCKYCKPLLFNPVCRFMGVRSLEMYAVQGIVFRTLYDKIGNRAIFAAIAVMCIILLGYLTHKLNTFLISKLPRCKAKRP